MTATEDDGLGSAFEALRERATPKTDLYQEMQETSEDTVRSEKELEDEVRQEMIERAEETEAVEHKDTKLTGYISK